MTMSRTLKQGGIAKRERVDEKFFYVNNEEFYAAIKDYLIYRDECISQGKNIPQIPDYIGASFYKIASFMARKPNFISYSFKDEMISDAVLNMCTYVHKFNYKEHTNPFSYFMQSCFYSFLLRIKKEKRQTIVKAHITQNLGTILDDVMLELQDSDDPAYKSAAVELLQMRSSDVVKAHMESKEKKKKKNQPVPIEDLMSSEEPVWNFPNE